MHSSPRPIREVYDPGVSGTFTTMLSRSNPQRSIQIVPSSGAVLTYTAQWTLADVQDPDALAAAVWVDSLGAVDATGGVAYQEDFPVVGWRINVTSHTSGTLSIFIVQST